LIESVPGRYDFSSAQRIMDAANEAGVELVWDLLHFGWPDHLTIFDPLWVESFGLLAGRFGKILKQAGACAFVAPVNEISFLSWAGGEEGYLNPFSRKRGKELKEQLVCGYVKAANALRQECPDVILVSPEPVIHIVGRPNVRGDVSRAAEYRSAMFEAWDMITGRVHPTLGGSEDCIDVIGVNYYDRNQWWNFGKTITRDEPEYRPFGDILAEVYARYRRPMVVSESGTEDADRPAWFRYISEQVRAAKRAGVPIHGICWYPILDHPGWDDDRHCHNGLWSYAAADGSRPIYQPLADEMKRQERLNDTYDYPSCRSAQAS
jgi:hypothetical protein